MNDIMNALAPGEVTRSIIMVAGVGGAGGNALNHMVDLGINDVTFMACNTDAQALERSKASIRIQLGSGLGAGNMPEKGSQAAKESIDDIIDVLRSEGTRMLFITAGMGGGTGTGASPIIARAAQELDILTVAIVTTPYSNEGKVRTEQAQKGIEELREYTDSLLVLSNDSIEDLYGDLPMFEGFWKADDVLSTAVKGIAEIITGHGTVNVDFADVNTVMRGSGRAFMGSARAEGDNRALEAVEASVTSLLLNHRDIRGAKNILLNISYGGREVTQREAGIIRDYLQQRTGWTANLIWGTASKPNLGDELELTIVATGFPGETDDVVSVPPPAETTSEHAPRFEPTPRIEHAPQPAAPRYTPTPHYSPTPTASPHYTPTRPVGSAQHPAAGGTQSGFRGATAPQRSAQAAQSGTVQWRGVDRYADIDHIVSVPAWVRRKARLTNPYEDRPAGKAALEKDDSPVALTGNLFES